MGALYGTPDNACGLLPQPQAERSACAPVKSLGELSVGRFRLWLEPFGHRQPQALTGPARRRAYRDVGFILVHDRAPASWYCPQSQGSWSGVNELCRSSSLREVSQHPIPHHPMLWGARCPGHHPSGVTALWPAAATRESRAGTNSL